MGGPIWETCNTCEGTGKVPITMKVRCQECGGTGSVPDPSLPYALGRILTVSCFECHGTGLAEVETSSRECPDCHGKGGWEERGYSDYTDVDDLDAYMQDHPDYEIDDDTPYYRG